MQNADIFVWSRNNRNLEIDIIHIDTCHFSFNLFETLQLLLLYYDIKKEENVIETKKISLFKISKILKALLDCVF